MATSQTNRTAGLRSSVAVKGPCLVAATSNITLSGEQTIDGIALVTGDRVLVTAQTSSVDNGIYVVSTGTWSRAPDFSRSDDVVEGTQVYITRGTHVGGYVLTTQGDITFGTSLITFASLATVVSGALSTTLNLSDLSSTMTGWKNIQGVEDTVASAATVDLSDPANVTSSYILISGSVSISAFTMMDNDMRVLRFTGAPQITVGASLVANNKGGNLQLEAGDHAIVHKKPSGAVHFVHIPYRPRAPMLQKGVAVASAATLVLPDCEYVHVTGTTGITDVDLFDATDGNSVTCEFDGALTISHSATLKCPGNTSLPVAAGDVIRFVQDSGDTVKVVPLGQMATVAEVWAGTAYKPISPAVMMASLAEVALTDGATVTIDFTTGINFKLDTIGGNRTAAAAITSNVVGRSGRIRVKQDSTGSRTLDLSGTPWVNVNGQNLVLSTPANSVDFLFYDIYSTSAILLSMGRAVS